MMKYLMILLLVLATSLHSRDTYPKPKPFATEVAMRGKWKLLAFEGRAVELFDIKADPNETQNILNDQPDLVASLTAELKDWLNAPRVPQK